MSATPTQLEALKAYRECNDNAAKAAKKLGKSPSTVKELVRKALKWDETDPGVKASMQATGIGIGTIRGGWRIVEEVQPDGSKIRNSVRYSVDAPEIKSEDLAEAIKDALSDIIPLEPMVYPTDLNDQVCNFIPLADLHVGGEYGDPGYLATVHKAIRDLVASLPSAKKAVLIDMGDLLDANDHKGLTPASMNECDVIRENHLKNTIDAMNIMRLAIDLLAQTHEEVEVHLLRGNHDETAYIGVLVALAAHYSYNPQINIVVSDDNFRVIPWGNSAVFPHHGDKSKWEDLKNVFADQFPTEWAAAKYWRYVWTAHVHHDKQREMIGATGEHFRTLAAPNNWAQMKGLFSRGSIQCVTFHKELGEISRSKVNLPPLLLEEKPRKYLV